MNDPYYQTSKRQYLPLHRQNYPYQSPNILRSSADLDLTRPTVLSFDYHDTLTAPESREILPNTAQSVQHEIDRISSQYSIIPLLHSMGRPHNVKAFQDWMHISDSHMLGNYSLATDSEHQALDHVEQTVSTLPEVSIHMSESGNVIIRHTGIELSQSNDQIAHQLESILSREVVSEVSCWINRSSGVIGFHPRLGKNQIATRAFEYIGINPQEYLYVHFGDHTPDIPWLPSEFHQEYFICPENTSEETKPFASFLAPSPAPEAIIQFLQTIS